MLLVVYWDLSITLVNIFKDAHIYAYTAVAEAEVGDAEENATWNIQLVRGGEVTRLLF